MSTTEKRFYQHAKESNDHKSAQDEVGLYTASMALNQQQKQCSTTLFFVLKSDYDASQLKIRQLEQALKVTTEQRDNYIEMYYPNVGHADKAKVKRDAEVEAAKKAVV